MVLPLFFLLELIEGKLWEAAGCAATYLLLDPDDDTMIDNLRYFKEDLGHQSVKITARKVKWKFCVMYGLICLDLHCTYIVLC